MKFNEVQEYVTNIRYIFSLEPLIISESVFQQQSPNIQKMILDAGKEATAHSFTFLKNTESSIRNDLEKKGMVFVEPANGEKEWIDAIKKKHDKTGK